MPLPEPIDVDETERQTPLDRPLVDLPTFRVVVSASPEPLDRGKTVDVTPTTATPLFVGKSEACDLVLTDKKVSRRHLALELEAGGMRVRDLESTNGTKVGELSISGALLRGGEKISIGSTEITIELVGAATSVRFPPVEAFGNVLGVSAPMRRLYPLLQRLAVSDVPVLIEGETGTGKELLAESLHKMGPNHARPFVVFDQNTVSAKDVDRVLFGEEVRERSGVKRYPGVFEEAEGGTLLIDEAAELPLIVQAKLLRVLESKEVLPVGGARWIPVNARVIAITAQDLERAVERQRFREDLYYRLAVGRVALPPLRARDGDERVLAEHFWRLAGGEGPLPSDLLASHAGHTWPGNVRELANVIERRVLGLAAAERMSTGAPPVITDNAFQRVLAMNLSMTRAREEVVAAFERCYLERIIAEHNGNITRAAAASGLARRYFNVLRTKHRTR